MSDTSPVMVMFCLTGVFLASDKSAVMMVQPADGPSLGVAPYKQQRKVLIVIQSLTDPLQLSQ